MSFLFSPLQPAITGLSQKNYKTFQESLQVKYPFFAGSKS